MKYMCGSCCIPTKFRVGIYVGKLLNFVVTYNKKIVTKSEKKAHFRYFFAKDNFNV